MSAVGLLASSENQMNEALNRLIREPDLRIPMSSSAIRRAELSTGNGSPNSGRRFWSWLRSVITRIEGSESRELHEARPVFIQNFVPVACMTRRVAILTEIIAPYRIPVFNALAQHEGIDLKVIFLAETHPTLRQWRVYKDEICFAYEVLPSWRFRVGPSHFLLNAGLSASLKKFSPDVIICGGYNYVASWQALTWARRHRVRFILWSESNAQDTRGQRKSVEFLKARFCKCCNGFVVPGKSALEYMRLLGSPATSIFTAPNAVDNTFFAVQAEQVKSQPGAFREKLGLPRRFILFVGRLVQEKGPFDLLEAYAKLESCLRSEVGLVFAGDGVCREELVQQAKRVSPGTVCFPGFVHREDLAGLYALAEALVLPTHSEVWGLVVNEAMACGLPIIVTSVTGCLADLVEDGWNGYVVPPRDSDKLSVAINSLVRQPELKQRMSASSLERIRNYSPEACADGLAGAAISAGTGAR
jgi:glycosyltransferase involved in cell wall biosynthesis